MLIQNMTCLSITTSNISISFCFELGRAFPENFMVVLTRFELEKMNNFRPEKRNFFGFLGQ